MKIKSGNASRLSGYFEKMGTVRLCCRSDDNRLQYEYTRKKCNKRSESQSINTITKKEQSSGTVGADNISIEFIQSLGKRDNS